MRYNKISKGKEGFALVTVIMIMAIIIILGLGVLSSSTSTFKMTRIDSDIQSVYYIAESGVNYIIDEINTKVEGFYKESSSSEEFFKKIEDEYTTRSFELNNFEDNFGRVPKAIITVKVSAVDGETKDFIVESTGIIGNSKRKVNSIITINWINKDGNTSIDDLFIYSKDFNFSGTTMNGEGGSLILDGLETHNLNGGSALNVSNLYFNGPVNMDGGSASFGNKNKPGKIYVKGDLFLWNGERNVYGDVHVDGGFKLKDAMVHGNVYVDGDLELGWTPEINKEIYYTGKLIAPDNYDSKILNKCKKVTSVPPIEIPQASFKLKEDSWYRDNGYQIREAVSENNIPDNAKMLVDNYNSNSSQNPSGNIVIISKGNIIIKSWRHITGVLIAPNGKVEHDGNFTGIIISKDGINLAGGGTSIDMKRFADFFTEATMPVIISETGTGDEDDNQNSQEIPGMVIIKSNIIEK